MSNTLIVSIGCSLICFGIFFMLSLAIIQTLGIDRDKVQYKTGKLTKPTKKQLLYALISTVGLCVILGFFLFFYN